MGLSLRGVLFRFGVIVLGVSVGSGAMRLRCVVVVLSGLSVRFLRHRFT
jgi:hypothetical protein